jgi:hypothetical protein
LKAITYSKCGRKINGSLKVTPRNAVWLHRVLLFSYPGEKCVRSQPLVDKDKTLLPKIREVINGDPSEHLFMETEKSAWLTFEAVCPNFLRNIKSANCKEFVEDLLNAYQIHF